MTCPDSALCPLPSAGCPPSGLSSSAGGRSNLVARPTIRSRCKSRRLLHRPRSQNHLNQSPKRNGHVQKSQNLGSFPSLSVAHNSSLVQSSGPIIRPSHPAQSSYPRQLHDQHHLRSRQQRWHAPPNLSYRVANFYNDSWPICVATIGRLPPLRWWMKPVPICSSRFRPRL